MISSEVMAMQSEVVKIGKNYQDIELKQGVFVTLRSTPSSLSSGPKYNKSLKGMIIQAY